MQETLKRRATYADIEALPPHVVGEILAGNLVTHPRPAPPHSVTAAALGAALGPPYQFGVGGSGGWIFMTEPELHFGDDVVVPEIAGWRLERMPELPETAYIETSPDWACEVLSPRTEKYDRGVKRAIYAEAGVAHLWLVDPRSKVLEVFKLTDGDWLLVLTLTDEDAVRGEPFAEVEFPLSWLWPLTRRGEA